MGKVIAYGRVSTQRQADQGALERQERQLLEGVTADEILMDVGSGKTTARPAYQRLLDLIGSGQVDRVLIKEQDRLNRNLKADLELWELCQANGTKITDLHGREIEFRTPDGELLSTMVSAMNQHRSKAYGLKIRNGLQQARKDRKPARPTSTFPFGYRPVRDAKGKIEGVELDPDKAKLARERVDVFLAGNSLSETSRQILDKQGADLKPNGLSIWLRHPYLRGRLCWGSDGKGNFSEVAAEPTFQAILTDAEADLIKAQLAATNFNQGLRNRQRRFFSNLARCADCGYALTYRISDKVGKTQYLRCKHRHCPKSTKAIHVDRVFGVMQFALMEHAAALVPLLDRPKVDPPEIAKLQQEVEALAGISGTEALIETKRAEIAALRVSPSETPQWLLLGAARSMAFWMQDEAKVNQLLVAMGCQITVQLGDKVKDARVKEVRFNTSPAVAPLPPDQDNIRLESKLSDLVLLVDHQEQIRAVYSGLG